MSIFNLISNLLFPKSSAPLPPTDRVPDELILYKFNSCPYCRRVMRVVEKHSLPVKYRDTRKQPEYRQDLLQMNGKTQVPCLLIDGEPLLESVDIIRYLQAVFKIMD